MKKRKANAIAAHFRNSAGAFKNKKKHKNKYKCRKKINKYDYR